jgi:hypothetical protein
MGGIIFILILAMVGFLFFGLMMSIESKYHLVSKWVSYTMFAVGGLCAVTIIGLCIWANTNKVYRVHDVTVRVYYLDGSQKLLHLERIPQNLPYIDSRGTKPYLVTGKGHIPYIDRFDVIEEKCYEMKGGDFNKKED